LESIGFSNREGQSTRRKQKEKNRGQIRKIQTSKTTVMPSKGDPLNKTIESTMFDDQSEKQDLFSTKNMTAKRPGSGGSMQKPQTRITNSLLTGQIDLEKRKGVTEIYKHIDEMVLKEKKPHEVIDPKTQKIEINPGIPYNSTSQDAVFEIRKENEARMVGRQQNQYIAIPASKYDEDNDSEAEVAYIRPRDHPF
jgi:hypothetical protein